VELETLAIPPRETLTLALAPPREAAGEPGSRRAADPDPDAVAPSRADRGRSCPNPAGIRGVSPRVRVCTVVNRAGGGSPGGVRDVIGFGDFFEGDNGAGFFLRGICAGGEIGSSVLLDLAAFWSPVLGGMLNFRF
jgi:hypothetical protein